MRRPDVIGAAALLLGVMAAAPAAAACEVSVSLVEFGRVELARGAEITGEVAVRCPTARRFSLALSPGHGDYRMRKMLGPNGAELAYNLFVDPAHRRVWGDGITAGTARLTGRTDGRKTTLLTVYGRIPRGQRGGRAGAYADALTVTLEP